MRCFEEGTALRGVSAAKMPSLRLRMVLAAVTKGLSPTRDAFEQKRSMRRLTSSSVRSTGFRFWGSCKSLRLQPQVGSPLPLTTFPFKFPSRGISLQPIGRSIQCHLLS